jgi:hypothetical protein
MPVYSQSPSPSYDVFKFRRFRFNLVRFLRLPMDISERDLRDAVLECSVNVFADYVIRAKRAAAQSGGAVEVMVRHMPTSVPLPFDQPVHGLPATFGLRVISSV